MTKHYKHQVESWMDKAWEKDWARPNPAWLSTSPEAGVVTPGIEGRLAGGLLASVEWRICIKNALS